MARHRFGGMDKVGGTHLVLMATIFREAGESHPVGASATVVSDNQLEHRSSALHSSDAQCLSLAESTRASNGKNE